MQQLSWQHCFTFIADCEPSLKWIIFALEIEPATWLSPLTGPVMPEPTESSVQGGACKINSEIRGWNFQDVNSSYPLSSEESSAQKSLGRQFQQTSVMEEGLEEMGMARCSESASKNIRLL